MDPKSLLRKFRSGMDTTQIAKSLGVKESAVVAALHLAREEEHRGKHPADSPVPAKCKPALAHDSKRRNV